MKGPNAFCQNELGFLVDSSRAELDVTSVSRGVTPCSHCGLHIQFKKSTF